MLTNGLPPVHPGDFLREILDDLHLTQAAKVSVKSTETQRFQTELVT